MLLTQAADRGRIQGVYIQETDDQVTHSQFVDDRNIVVEAKREYVEETFAVFRKLGDASALHIKYIGVKVVLISDHPLPHELAHLDFLWENNQACSKLLEVFVGTEISPLLMGHALQTTLEERLKRARKFPYTLAYRVAIANQLMSNNMMYMLNLWPGKRKQLKEFDDLIWDFVWSGQEMGKKARVDYETMKRSLADGELVLLSIEEQTTALAIKLVLWIVQVGDHTAQCILKAKFGELSLRKWGKEDFSWLMAPGRTLPIGGTDLFYTLCEAWI